MHLNDMLKKDGRFAYWTLVLQPIKHATVRGYVILGILTLDGLQLHPDLPAIGCNLPILFLADHADIGRGMHDMKLLSCMNGFF